MPTGPRKPAWIVNLLILGMLPCYVALYALNVRQVVNYAQPGPPPWDKEAWYRVGGKAAEIIFWPIETIDRACVRERGLRARFITVEHL